MLNYTMYTRIVNSDLSTTENEIVYSLYVLNTYFSQMMTFQNVGIYCIKWYTVVLTLYLHNNN